MVTCPKQGARKPAKYCWPGLGHESGHGYYSSLALPSTPAPTGFLLEGTHCLLPGPDGQPADTWPMPQVD